MPSYSDLYIGNELIQLRDGLEVLERVVEPDTLKKLDLWLFGIVTDEYTLGVAKDAIISNAEEFMDEVTGDSTLTEDDIELTEIAVAIPISYSSNIDMLYGRGWQLRELDFAYQAGEGEGIRTTGFAMADFTSGSIKMDDLGAKAIAEGDWELDEFLKEKGKGLPMQIKRKVERNEEATVDAPHVPEAPAPEAPPPAEAPAAAIPKQTSLRSEKLSDIVENFLG